jgi:hypothetical protein
MKISTLIFCGLVLIKSGNASDPGCPCPVPLTTAAPCLECAYNIKVMGELLWWKSSQSGREFALVGLSGTGHRKILTLPYDWDPGFRIGIGYDFPTDRWDLQLLWTEFYNFGSKTTRKINQILPLDTALGTTTFYSFTKSEVRSRLNLVDLQLGREYFVSDWVALHPFAGIRAQWIMQKQQVGFSFNNMAPGVSSRIFSWHRGIGLRAGLDSDWKLGSDFSLFGNVALSLIYGSMQVDGQYYSDHFTTKTFGMGTYEIQDMTIVPDGDLGIGLRWEYIYCKRLYLALEVAYELHFFSDQWRWHNYATPFSGGNTLCTEGFTFGGRVEF